MIYVTASNALMLIFPPTIRLTVATVFPMNILTVSVLYSHTFVVLVPPVCQ